MEITMTTKKKMCRKVYLGDWTAVRKPHSTYWRRRDLRPQEAPWGGGLFCLQAALGKGGPGVCSACWRRCCHSPLHWVCPKGLPSALRCLLQLEPFLPLPAPHPPALHLPKHACPPAIF